METLQLMKQFVTLKKIVQNSILLSVNQILVKTKDTPSGEIFYPLPRKILDYKKKLRNFRRHFLYCQIKPIPQQERGFKYVYLLFYVNNTNTERMSIQKQLFTDFSIWVIFHEYAQSRDSR